MSKHFQREVERLKRSLLSLSAVVEDAVWVAVKSVEEGHAASAARVIDGDAQVDQMEVDIEEECLKILALYHPVAFDLRFIVAVLKMNNDLERIGDLAVNIAKRALALAERRLAGLPLDFHDMGAKAKSMLRRSLDALVNQDPDLAREIRKDDDEMDAMNRAMTERIKVEIRKRPENLDALLQLLNISRHLERIADQATNIAEDVIYLVQGQIVRHKAEDLPSCDSGVLP